MEWFIIFQSLAKLSQWIVKPDLWCSNSKIFGLTFPQILDISFQSGKWWEGRGLGNSQSRGLSLWVWLSGSAFRGTYPVPTLYSGHPLSHLAFSLPPPTPHCFPPTLSSYSAGRLGQTLSWLGGKRKGWWKPLQGLSLKPWWWKDSTNLNNFSQENSILCLLKSKAFSNP